MIIKQMVTKANNTLFEKFNGPAEGVIHDESIGYRWSWIYRFSHL